MGQYTHNKYEVFLSLSSDSCGGFVCFFLLLFLIRNMAEFNLFAQLISSALQQ